MNFLTDYQIAAVNNLRNGSILCGGVGTGKSRTSIDYYYEKVIGGKIIFDDRGIQKRIEPIKDIPLYIITTAKKRDKHEWDEECVPFLIEPEVVDSWNNIEKYVNVENAFFIFDEQRVIGSGAWVKAFLKITKANQWILLSATPGDTWMDYIPVFIANGFYKNRTAFIREHVVYNQFSKYPKIDKYVGGRKLVRYRDSILVNMDSQKKTTRNYIPVKCEYDKKKFDVVFKKRWDPYEDEPVQEVGKLYLLLRRVVNEDQSRLERLWDIFNEHKKVIVFYNFNFELELMRNVCDQWEIDYAEYNGHRHQDIPNSNEWIYMVQYNAGAEGWNCVETDTMVFYSMSYSYRLTEQASGRIDRMNTPFDQLYYYQLYSDSYIDQAIKRSLDRKEDFNERRDYDSL